MKSFTRNIIKYSGLENCVNSSCPTTNNTNFKQTSIDVKFCIPCKKPDVEQVVKVDLSSKVHKTRLVKTPKGVSLEGQIITGDALLVMGDITLKIAYVADQLTQSMHTVHVEIPFCEYVVLPETLCMGADMTPEIYIEDVHISQQDKRCLFGNITVMIAVNQC